MIGFTQAQASMVVATARHIEQDGPPAARIAARMLALVLRFIRPDQRRAVALAIAEIALRDARTAPTAANGSTPQ